MKNDQIEIYKKRLEAEKQFVKNATEKAVQQRVFTVWCMIMRMPDELIAYLIQSSNRSLFHIEKINKSLSRLERTILALEAISKHTEKSIIQDLNNAYKTDTTGYEYLVTRLKSEGIKIYRNSHGNHKIEWNCIQSKNNGEQ